MRSVRADLQRFSGSERAISVVLPPSGFLIAATWLHLWATGCSCRRHRWFEQVAQPNQVVGDHVQAKHRTHLVGAAQLELAQTAPLLDPAKHLLDAAVGIDRLGVALMAAGADIDGGTTKAADVLSDVRRDADAAHLGDKAPSVVVLVATDGLLLVGTGTISRHRFGSIPLPGAHRLHYLAIDDQSMVVVHEHMAPVARECRMGIGPAGQQRIWITAGAMGLVAELDAAEMTLGPLLALFGLTKSLARA